MFPFTPSLCSGSRTNSYTPNTYTHTHVKVWVTQMTLATIHRHTLSNIHTST